jgi:hypothetical protein
MRGRPSKPHLRESSPVSHSHSCGRVHNGDYTCWNRRTADRLDAQGKRHASHRIVERSSAELPLQESSRLLAARTRRTYRSHSHTPSHIKRPQWRTMIVLIVNVTKNICLGWEETKSTNSMNFDVNILVIEVSRTKQQLFQYYWDSQHEKSDQHMSVHVQIRSNIQEISRTELASTSGC